MIDNDKLGFHRINSLANTFAKIALENYKDYNDCIKNIPSNAPDDIFTDKALTKEEEEAYFKKEELESLSDKHYLSGVVFCAMATEAYINDVSRIELGDSYVDKHLDKLSLESKYLITMHLISGVKVDNSKEWFNLLKKLIKTRNHFIHAKSKKVNQERLCNDPEYIDSLRFDKIELVDAIKLLYLLHKEVYQLDNAKHHFPFLLWYDEDFYNSLEDFDKERLMHSVYREIFFNK